MIGNFNYRTNFPQQLSLRDYYLVNFQRFVRLSQISFQPISGYQELDYLK